MTTLLIEKTTMDILSEKYPQVKREIICNFHEWTDEEYQQHGWIYEKDADDTLHALFVNSALAQNFEQAIEIITAQCGGISMGNHTDVSLALRFWAYGRELETTLN